MKLLVPALLAALSATSQATLQCQQCKDPDSCTKNPPSKDCPNGYCTYLKYDQVEVRTCAAKPEILYGPQKQLFTTVSDDCTKITVDKVDYFMKICNDNNCNANCKVATTTTTSTSTSTTSTTPRVTSTTTTPKTSETTTPKGTATLTPTTLLNALLCLCAAASLL